MKLMPISRQSSVDLVVERIQNAIRDRKLPPGTRLPGEHELVEQLQVSRPVLREGLARLQSLGLVEIQRGRGTFVGNPLSLMHCLQLLRTALIITPQELISYTELRTAIEVQAVRQAAELATEKDIAELEGLLLDLNRQDRPAEEILEVDFRFHRKLIEVAGNPLMKILMEVIFEFVLAQMARTSPPPQDNELGQKLHQQIMDAVKNHDPDAAEEAMRCHMDIVLGRLRATVQQAETHSAEKY